MTKEDGEMVGYRTLGGGGSEALPVFRISGQRRFAEKGESYCCHWTAGVLTKGCGKRDEGHHHARTWGGAAAVRRMRRAVWKSSNFQSCAFNIGPE